MPRSVRTIYPVLDRNFIDDVSSLAFSPDSKMLAFGDRKRVILADLRTGRELRKFEPEQAPGQPIGLAFTPELQAMNWPPSTKAMTHKSTPWLFRPTAKP